MPDMPAELHGYLSLNCGADTPPLASWARAKRIKRGRDSAGGAAMGSEHTGPGPELRSGAVPSLQRALPQWAAPEFEVISTGMELSMYAATASAVNDP